MEIHSLSAKALDAGAKIIHTKHMKVRLERNWRKELTDGEKAEVQRLEREMAKIGRQILALRNERKKIQNRATQRVGK